MALSPSVEVDFDVSKKVSLRLMEIENLVIEERVLATGTARSFTVNEKDRRVWIRESQTSHKVEH